MQLSSSNPKVQQLRRLTGRRSARYDEGLFVVEGPILVLEALRSGWNIVECFVSPDSDFHVEVPIYELDERTFDSVSDVKTPQGVMAVVEMRPPKSASIRGDNWCLVADGISDPGNLGTMMRSAEASGASEVVLLNNSVDPYSPKVVRSSAGALFHLATRVSTYEQLCSEGLRLLGLTSHDSVNGESVRSMYDVDVDGRIGVVVGSEAHGISPSSPIDQWVTIPHEGRAESLNAAMAATVMCMHVAHARSKSVPQTPESLH